MLFWSCDRYWQCCSGHATATGSAVLVMRPLLAVSFWSCDHYWQCRSGHVTATGSVVLVMRPLLAVPFWSCDRYWQCHSGHATTTGSAVLVMRLLLAVPFWSCDASGSAFWSCIDMFCYFPLTLFSALQNTLSKSASHSLPLT